jgi:hypothetical protein
MLPRYLQSQNAELRGKFRLGFHDGRFFIANLLLPDRYRYSVVPRGSGYNYLSMSNYYASAGLDWADLRAMLRRQLVRYRNLYPQLPVVVGEFGATRCAPMDAARQAAIDGSAVAWFASRRVGFNLWGWQAPTPTRCASDAGLYLRDYRGRSGPALAAVAAALHRAQTRRGKSGGRSRALAAVAPSEAGFARHRVSI